ncbi:MAG: acetyl-CoA carboxylase biotin carboxyl carrier protein [Alphaproteobacteria bacterium]|nr:acetyl-CoA carboxylase biotin carboxyl carrier protein [Alphaproteobacteria bacterium]
MPTKNARPEFGPSSATVRRLAKLLEETGLTEIEYQDGTRRLKVARGTLAAPAAAAPAAAPAARAVEAVPAASEGPPAGAVTSPMVGTCYLSPEPGAPAFVKVGDKVREGQTLVIVEAMKVMNPIRSPRGGTVASIAVENGAPVEYGEVLLVVE